MRISAATPQAMDDQTAATDDQAERPRRADELARLRRENAALRTLIARMVHSAGGVYLVPQDALLQVELAHHRLEATTTASGLEVRLRPGAAPGGVTPPAPVDGSQDEAQPLPAAQAAPRAVTAEAPEAPAQLASEPATQDNIEAAAQPLPEPVAAQQPAEPMAAPAPRPLTQGEVMAMPLAAFEAHFGFRPEEALEKYWFAITGKRLGAAERAAIAASLAGRMPDLSHVVMK
jgi:hypothetical protein